MGIRKLSFIYKNQERARTQAWGPKYIRVGLMKGRQLSTREIEFCFPGCSCLCASLVIDHLGADLSFTAVIIAKCKAIYHPLSFQVGQSHFGCL